MEPFYFLPVDGSPWGGTRAPQLRCQLLPRLVARRGACRCRLLHLPLHRQEEGGGPGMDINLLWLPTPGVASKRWDSSPLRLSPGAAFAKDSGDPCLG